jgi:hypothetical protein
MKLTHINVLDLAKAFASIYALLSVVAISAIVFGTNGSAASPLGLYLGPIHLSINWTFNHVHEHPTFLAMAIIGQLLGWALTGAISGAVLGVAFNSIGKDLLSIEVKTQKIQSSSPFEI